MSWLSSRQAAEGLVRSGKPKQAEWNGVEWSEDMMPTTGAGRRFVEELVQTAEADPAIIDRPGTTLAPTEGRAGSNVCIRYLVGEHVLLWHDPALTESLEALASEDVSLSDDAWTAAIAERGWEDAGSALMKILPAPLEADRALPGGFSLHRFDWSRPDDLALVQALIDVSTEDDLDEAELEMENLDEMAVGLVDANGAIAAYASARDWDYGKNFGDIGVIVRADVRGQGLGVAVVDAIIAVTQAAGIDPLYRCDPDNAGSDLLSKALGFVVQTSLRAAVAS